MDRHFSEHCSLYIYALFIYIFREGVENCWVNNEMMVIYCPIQKSGSASFKLAMVMSTTRFQKRYPNLTANDIAEKYSPSYKGVSVYNFNNNAYPLKLG